MNTFGHNFRITVWGESHGTEIGVVIDGVPAGIALSEADFEADLSRRRSGASGTTPRRESDTPVISSGIYRGRTTGAPLAIRFTNGDTRPEDYDALASHYRPSHADRTAAVRFGGMNDPRGGGHLSGRMTLALVAAGVVAKRVLPEEIRFATEIDTVGGTTDPARFEEVIAAAAAAGDSVGATVRCRIDGIPAGWGDPWFDSAESLVAHLALSIPAVKGVEFGRGFAVAAARGSENNDLITGPDGRTATNHDGGINGGITNGNTVEFRVAFKPTPSIAREQQSYNAASGRVEPLTIGGRHDACIALRGAVAIEAAAAIALADLALRPAPVKR